MTTESWTPLKLIEWTTQHFEKKGIPNPRLDAEWLLASCLQCERIELYTYYNKPVQAQELKQFRALVERRAQREPLQYIMGETEFYGLPIKTAPDVLIPRPETELLVEEALKTSPGETLDIGTGSGCIAVALAKNLTDAAIVATDLNAAALELARENAKLNDVADRIEFAEADLFPGKGAASSAPTFSLIVSNPPYIPTPELDELQLEVRDWEPRTALDGGEAGLEVYRRIADGLAAVLADGGYFIGEIGNDQEAVIRDLFEAQKWCSSVVIKKDLAGHPRIVIAKRG